MADLHPAYPKEGADQQDAHAREPRNFGIMRKEDLGMQAPEVVHHFNEKDSQPEVYHETPRGVKNTWELSPNELRQKGYGR